MRVQCQNVHGCHSVKTIIRIVCGSYTMGLNAFTDRLCRGVGIKDQGKLDAREKGYGRSL